MIRSINNPINICPHCNTNEPILIEFTSAVTIESNSGLYRYWKTYKCISCGGIITACSYANEGQIISTYPKVKAH